VNSGFGAPTRMLSLGKSSSSEFLNENVFFRLLLLNVDELLTVLLLNSLSCIVINFDILIQLLIKLLIQL
jgi:hypothetical protein